MASDASRQVLKTDFFAGLAAVAAGLLTDGVTAVLALPLVTVGFGLLVATGLGVAEHGLVPGLYPSVAALAALVTLVVVAAALVALLARPTETVATAMAVGGGTGIVGYRAVFGLLRPVPAARLAP